MANNRVKLKDILEKVEAVRLLLKTSPNSWQLWFDKNFYNMNRFPTGTETKLIYLYYTKENARISEEAFNNLLSASFELFEHMGWDVKDGKVTVGQKPVLSLKEQLALYDKLQNRLSRGKLKTFFEILGTALDHTSGISF